MVNAATLPDGALGEHVGLALQLAPVVYVFQRAEQIIGRIVRKGQPVCPRVDEAVLLREGIVQRVHLRLQGEDFLVPGVVHLRVHQAMHAVPQGDQPFDALLRSLIHLRADHDAVLTEVNLSIHDGIGIVFDIRVCGKGFAAILAVCQIGQLRLPICAADAFDRFRKLLRQLRALDGLAGRFLLIAVHAPVPRHAAQHHVGMLSKVGVDGDAVLRLTQMYPRLILHDGSVPFLEKENVRGHFRARIGPERIVRQADCAQQLRALGDVTAHFGRCLVHRALAGDKRDDAARAHLVECLGEEVIMNQEVVRIELTVIELVAAKGHVADGQIEEILPVRLFKARNRDVGLGIELPRDAPGEAVQLHAVEPAAAHGVGQQAEEIAHAARRLQHVARAKAHALHRVVDGANDRRRRVMRVERRGARHVVFLRCEQRFQLHILLLPFLLALVKSVGQAAPAHIA